MKNGSIIAFTDADGRPPMALEWDMRLWWPQCEAMIALRLAAGVFNERRYQVWYDEILEYVETHFRDREYGEWFGYLHYDGTVSTTLKGNIFKGCFHVPRFYMIMDTMDSTGGIQRFMQ